MQIKTEYPVFEFLCKLQATPRTWHLAPWGARRAIRSSLPDAAYGLLFCPLEVTAQRYTFKAAAAVLNLCNPIYRKRIKPYELIIDAADDYKGHHPFIRATLLNACGIGEENGV